ncbi:ParB/RepB/Spo0J family partition protein [Consotaella aegiceratis]|uniref:ParB/RepB/Spo0J family partition protein n=1 Tax=Consotaella aegiceratis TaxID=3097961 RepID=UPI002F3ECA1C
MNEDRSRQRLGRGLASLIGGNGEGFSARFEAKEGTPARPATERMLPIDRIIPNPRNPRRTFDPADLADLAASVKAHGVVQPILVRPAEDPDRFEIVAGERRFRASRLAGLSEVPVLVREFTDRQSLEIAIIENVQRTDLNAVEEARGYQMLVQEHGYTQSDLAEVLGKSRSHVANTLRLLKLPQEVQDMIVRGDLSAGHARTAVTVDDPGEFAREIVSRGLTVREAEKLARDASDSPASPRKRRGSRTDQPKDSDTAALERLLSDALGMAVSIRIAGDGGDIRIAYRSLDELDEICRLLQAHQAAETARRRQ